MKLNRWSQSILAITSAVAVGGGLVSCGTSNTIDYLYALSSKNNPGSINGYLVDSQSGALTQIKGTPVPTGDDPVALTIDSQGQNMYVATNLDNTVEQYGIGTDGKLYAQNSVNPSGSQPIALAVHTYKNANFLFVVETYQPNFTTLAPGPGALYVYQLNNGAPGSPVTQTVNGAASLFLPLGNTPTATVVTDDGLNVYVTDLLGTTPPQTGNPSCGPGQGAIQGYNMQFDSSGNATGVLQPIVGSPFCAGVAPSAIAVSPEQPNSRAVYVTDSAQNQVIPYRIVTPALNGPQPTNIGALTTLSTGPIATGVTPAGIVADPRGEYVYVANRFGPSVSGYTVNQGTNALSALSTGGTGGTGAQPTCVIVEPALARFVYTANFVDNSISGFVLDPNTGALSATQGGFYGTSGLTSCVAATQHGNHPVIVDPSQSFPNGGTTTP